MIEATKSCQSGHKDLEVRNTKYPTKLCTEIYVILVHRVLAFIWWGLRSDIMCKASYGIPLGKGKFVRFQFYIGGRSDHSRQHAFNKAKPKEIDVGANHPHDMSCGQFNARSRQTSSFRSIMVREGRRQE